MAWPLNSGAAGRDSAPPVAAGPRPAARVRRAARRAGPAVRAWGRSGGPGLAGRATGV